MIFTSDNLGCAHPQSALRSRPIQPDLLQLTEPSDSGFAKVEQTFMRYSDRKSRCSSRHSPPPTRWHCLRSTGRRAYPLCHREAHVHCA